MNIECSFGMLVRRWGILWKPLEMRFNRMNKVIMCCFKLHNLCVDRRLGEYELNAVDLAGGARTMAVLRRPRFDRDGIPVSLLVWHGHERARRSGRECPTGYEPARAAAAECREERCDDFEIPTGGRSSSLLRTHIKLTKRIGLTPHYPLRRKQSQLKNRIALCFFGDFFWWRGVLG